MYHNGWGEYSAVKIAGFQFILTEIFIVEWLRRHFVSVRYDDFGYDFSRSRTDSSPSFLIIVEKDGKHSSRMVRLY